MKKRTKPKSRTARKPARPDAEKRSQLARLLLAELGGPIPTTYDTTQFE